jgi:hypothetical protein
MENAKTPLEKMMVRGGTMLAGAISKQLIVAGREDFWKTALERPEHQAPHPDCECGIYAYHRFGQVFNRRHLFGALMTTLNEKIPFVVGAVQLWGKLEVHETGVRAQYAKPVLFIEHSMAHPIVTLNVAKRYGIEVATQAGYQGIVGSHGASSEKLFTDETETTP